ncbi:hypothetical protein BDN72DRAFT_858117 [Pluteus cervinus]|uniref:Uncharacterized protein n=1 Tax=Pluteus cervinus TaxID=181527 RepID=A0ACD3ATC5_9AGAR|nr:hypothetical protein BDN72DRAFT_858117 [Pluteus cervinus]
MSTFKINFTRRLATNQTQEEFKRIDEEIQKLHTQIRTLLTRRNRVTPISKLPAEIMTLIFSIVRDLPTTDWRSSKGRVILGITWVCKDWRELVLDTPELWRVIDLKATGFVQASLDRSRNLPLSIEFFGINQQAPSLPLVLQSLDRIKALQLSGQRDIGNAWFSFPIQWQRPALLLEELTLESVTISEFLFAGKIPCLRRLSLSECYFNSDLHEVPVSAHLNTLKIARSHPLLVMGDLLSLLRLSLNLEELELYETFARQHLQTPIHTLPSISHPRLRRLLISHEGLDMVIALLEKLTTSSTTYISVQKPRSCSLQHRPLLISAINKCRSREQVFPVSLKIRARSESSLIEVSEDGDRVDGPGFRVEFTHLNSDAVGSSVSACDLFSLSSLETLEIDGGDIKIPPALLSMAFSSNAPVLRTLKIYGVASAFVQRLTEEAKESHLLTKSTMGYSAGNAGEIPYPLRALECLELEGFQHVAHDLQLLQLALTAWTYCSGHLLKNLIIVVDPEDLTKETELFEDVVEHVEYREPALSMEDE